MYYILYDKKTLKVKEKYTKPLTAKVCDNFYEVYGIAEYKGEIPKGDWLTVDNVREEVETWKEKQQVEKLDENGQPIINEQGEPIYEEIEVEKSKTHIVCDLVAHFYPKIELTEEQKALQKEKQYKTLCEKYIREKYSANDEDKIKRECLFDMISNNTNKESKLQFLEYNSYVESCKLRAKEEVYK